MTIRATIAAQLLAGFVPAAGALTWDEAINGDLASNNLAPTALTFGPGLNVVKGTMGGDPGDGIPLDRDFFTVSVGPNQAITSINIRAFSPVGASFYAIGPGTTIDITNSATHLSNILINGTGEILPTLAAGSYIGGTGLSNPMGPGTYTIWFQEVSAVVTYDIAYTLIQTTPTKAVPFMPAGLLIAAAAGCCAIGLRALRGPATS